MIRISTHGRTCGKHPGSSTTSMTLSFRPTGVRFLTRCAQELDTWDVQLTFSCWRANALVVQPVKNLITNIGFGAEATFARSEDSIFARIPLQEMRFPLIHPKSIERAKECDDRTEIVSFSASPRDQLQTFWIARVTDVMPVIWKPDTSAR